VGCGLLVVGSCKTFGDKAFRARQGVHIFVRDRALPILFVRVWERKKYPEVILATLIINAMENIVQSWSRFRYLEMLCY